LEEMGMALRFGFVVDPVRHACDRRRSLCDTCDDGLLWLSATSNNAGPERRFRNKSSKAVSVDGNDDYADSRKTWVATMVSGVGNNVAWTMADIIGSNEGQSPRLLWLNRVI
jgi:hypothetical protein